MPRRICFGKTLTLTGLQSWTRFSPTWKQKYNIPNLSIVLICGSISAGSITFWSPRFGSGILQTIIFFRVNLLKKGDKLRKKWEKLKKKNKLNFLILCRIQKIRNPAPYIYTTRTVGLKVEKDELQNPRDYLNCYVQINNIILNILFINWTFVPPEPRSRTTHTSTSSCSDQTWDISGQGPHTPPRPAARTKPGIYQVKDHTHLHVQLLGPNLGYQKYKLR